MNQVKPRNAAITLGTESKTDDYCKALLAMLSKIEIGNCDPSFKVHIKNVYELLSHLQSKK